MYGRVRSAMVPVAAAPERSMVLPGGLVGRTARIPSKHSPSFSFAPSTHLQGIDFPFEPLVVGAELMLSLLHRCEVAFHLLLQLLARRLDVGEGHLEVLELVSPVPGEETPVARLCCCILEGPAGLARSHIMRCQRHAVKGEGSSSPAREAAQERMEHG